MSGECDKCSEHTLECKCKDLQMKMVDFLIWFEKCDENDFKNTYGCSKSEYINGFKISLNDL